MNGAIGRTKARKAENQEEENVGRSVFLACDSGSAENIFIPLQALLDEYTAWRSVKMIISDTAAVNTCHRNGVVARLQRQFRQKGLDEPQFIIGCQPHIFDLVLLH